MAKQDKTTASLEEVATMYRVMRADEVVAPEHTEAFLMPESVALCVRQMRQNSRQGTVACKDRSKMTSRSNRKPWKQKGTGRARAGSARSPLWRGGGVIHGPQPRVRELSVPKKLKRHVLHALLIDRLAHERIGVLSCALGDVPKTSQAAQSLKAAGLIQSPVLLFVRHDDYVTHASFANLPHVTMLAFDEPNVYALAEFRTWVVLDKDIDSFKNVVSAWI